MIGGYNIDFLIASLIILFLVLFEFEKQNQLKNASTKIFRLFLLTGIADVVLDLLSTFLLAWNIGELAGVTRVILTAFYLMQILMPYFAVYYTQTLRRINLPKIHRSMKLWGIVPMFLGVVVITNLWSEILFGFDAMGNYFHGPAYLLMYIYGIMYACALLPICICHRHEFSSREIRVVMEFLFIEGICVAVQAYDGRYLTTGFGIGLCMAILYLTINNPHIYVDYLTGCFNMTYLRVWVREQMEKEKSFHVIAADVSGLNRVAKIAGADVSDYVMMEIADKLRRYDKNAKVFRIAGKRFLIAVESLAEYESCRSYMQELFMQGFDVDHNGEPVRFRAVLCGMVGAETLQSRSILLAYLDYMAGLAANSEDTVLIQSDEKIMEGFLYEQEIERYLKTAVEDDLFELNYQPVYSLKEKSYVSMEVLSRLRHPNLGYVPPDVFIVLAERSGQISQISELQFRRLCRFLKEHRDILDKLESVKFNLSPLELMKCGHSRVLIDTIREFELPYAKFQFEITETAATEYSDNLYQLIKEFQQVGIGLCLDDFGVGYANCNTVMKLPFSAIKLDRSLLKDVCSEPQAAVFYQSIANVLKNMGFQVIAEGAETAEEVELLRSWNVNLIQGYYFSKPVSGTEILKVLEENQDKSGE